MMTTSTFRRPGRLLTGALAGLALFGLAACGQSTNYRVDNSEMTTHGPVDLDRYQGTWYEIARFPNSFQKSCVAVTADYVLQADGTMTVDNKCRQYRLDGPFSRVQGVAIPVADGDGPPLGDKFKVGFIPGMPKFAMGDYWILHVNQDYSMAVVGNPGGKVGWVLARSPRISPVDLEIAYDVLKRNGYNVAQIQKTRHKEY